MVLRISLLLPVLAASTLALPAPASAAAADASYRWNTRTIEQGPYAGEFDGVLAIRIAPDGTVQGTYRNADSGLPVDVSGGVRGKHIWLTIGTTSLDRRFDGTLQSGRLDIVGEDPVLADGRFTQLELIGDSPAHTPA